MAIHVSWFATDDDIRMNYSAYILGIIAAKTIQTFSKDSSVKPKVSKTLCARAAYSTLTNRIRSSPPMSSMSFLTKSLSTGWRHHSPPCSSNSVYATLGATPDGSFLPLSFRITWSLNRVLRVSSSCWISVGHSHWTSSLDGPWVKVQLDWDDHILLVWVAFIV